MQGQRETRLFRLGCDPQQSVALPFTYTKGEAHVTFASNACVGRAGWGGGGPIVKHFSHDSACKAIQN